MSTTETFRTVIDQVKHEVQKLQVENAKLKVSQSSIEGYNQDDTAAEELQRELEELRECPNGTEQ